VGEPTRDEFYVSRQETGWQWTPYATLARPPTSNDEYVALQRECKPTLPGIDGWSQQFSLF
jgi:hypothetical protein